MFAEISKSILANGTSLAFTVTKEDEKQLRVVIIPAKGEADEKSRLNQPLLVIDTPENLDAQLGAQLADYQLVRQEAVNTIAEAATALKEETEISRKKASDTRTRTAKAKADAVKSGEPTAKLDKAQADAKAARTGEQLTLGAETPSPAPTVATT